MHPPQYEAYRSGEAKKKHLADLEKRRAAASSAGNTAATGGTTPANFKPKSLNINVNGEQFKVSIAYDGQEAATNTMPTASPAPMPADNGNYQTILSPLEGKFYLTKDSSETAVKVGDYIKSGQTVGYVEAMKVYNAITSDVAGEVIAIPVASGGDIEEDDVMFKVK